MIITHRVTNGQQDDALVFDRHIVPKGESPPADAVWYDIFDPDEGDDHRLESVLGISVPTRDEMQDIDPSSLLYKENAALYMTARVLSAPNGGMPSLADVSFILTEKALVTVRYDNPRAFEKFASRLARPNSCKHASAAILDGLVDSIVDRSGEMLREVGDSIETVSHLVFDSTRTTQGMSNELNHTIRSLGRMGDLISHVRESMVSLERMLLFLSYQAKTGPDGFNLEDEWQADVKDVRALEDHASFLASKVQFLLDATLGLVSLQQNNAVKIFSVLAVIFMPPTLIASIYGMNFKQGMPELEWQYGYPYALSMMVLSAGLTYGVMKFKNWL